MQNKYIRKYTDLIASIENPIKNEIKRRDSGFNHEVFNVMHLTECPRRIMYRANQKEKLLVDLQSKYYKMKWLDIISNSKGIKVIDKNILAADSEYNLVGNVDAIIACGKYVSVIMFDAIDEKSDSAFEHGGLRRQIVSLMASMWLTEVDNGVLICENKNNNDYFLSHVTIHNSIINSVKTKCRKLMEDKILQQLPVRPYERNDSDECNGCEYKSKCWE